MIRHDISPAKARAGRRWAEAGAPHRTRTSDRGLRVMGFEPPHRQRPAPSIAILPLRSLVILLCILVPIGATLMIVSHFHMMSGEPVGLQGWLSGFRP